MRALLTLLLVGQLLATTVGNEEGVTTTQPTNSSTPGPLSELETNITNAPVSTLATSSGNILDGEGTTLVLPTSTGSPANITDVAAAINQLTTTTQRADLNSSLADNFTLSNATANMEIMTVKASTAPTTETESATIQELPTDVQSSMLSSNISAVPPTQPSLLSNTSSNSTRTSGTTVLGTSSGARTFTTRFGTTLGSSSTRAWRTQPMFTTRPPTTTTVGNLSEFLPNNSTGSTFTFSGTLSSSTVGGVNSSRDEPLAGESTPATTILEADGGNSTGLPTVNPVAGISLVGEPSQVVESTFTLSTLAENITNATQSNLTAGLSSGSTVATSSTRDPTGTTRSGVPIPTTTLAGIIGGLSTSLSAIDANNMTSTLATTTVTNSTLMPRTQNTTLDVTGESAVDSNATKVQITDYDHVGNTTSVPLQTSLVHKIMAATIPDATEPSASSDIINTTFSSNTTIRDNQTTTTPPLQVLVNSSSPNQSVLTSSVDLTPGSTTIRASQNPITNSTARTEPSLINVDGSQTDSSPMVQASPGTVTNAQHAVLNGNTPTITASTLLGTKFTTPLTPGTTIEPGTTAAPGTAAAPGTNAAPGTTGAQQSTTTHTTTASTMLSGITVPGTAMMGESAGSSATRAVSSSSSLLPPSAGWTRLAGGDSSSEDAEISAVSTGTALAAGLGTTSISDGDSDVMELETTVGGKDRGSTDMIASIQYDQAVEGTNPPGPQSRSMQGLDRHRDLRRFTTTFVLKAGNLTVAHWFSEIDVRFRTQVAHFLRGGDVSQMMKLVTETEMNSSSPSSTSSVASESHPSGKVLYTAVSNRKDIVADLSPSHVVYLDPTPVRSGDTFYVSFQVMNGDRHPDHLIPAKLAVEILKEDTKLGYFRRNIFGTELQDVQVGVPAEVLEISEAGAGKTVFEAHLPLLFAICAAVALFLMIILCVIVLASIRRSRGGPGAGAGYDHEKAQQAGQGGLVAGNAAGAGGGGVGHWDNHYQLGNSAGRRSIASNSQNRDSASSAEGMEMSCPQYLGGGLNLAADDECLRGEEHEDPDEESRSGATIPCDAAVPTNGAHRRAPHPPHLNHQSEQAVNRVTNNNNGTGVKSPTPGGKHQQPAAAAMSPHAYKDWPTPLQPLSAGPTATIFCTGGTASNIQPTNNNGHPFIKESNTRL